MAGSRLAWSRAEEERHDKHVVKCMTYRSTLCVPRYRIVQAIDGIRHNSVSFWLEGGGDGASTLALGLLRGANHVARMRPSPEVHEAKQKKKGDASAAWKAKLRGAGRVIAGATRAGLERSHRGEHEGAHHGNICTPHRTRSRS